MSDIVIITGGSRGIGAATARLLGSKGFAVVVNHRNSQAAALQVVADVERLGGRALAVQGDVGTEADVMHLFAETERVFGTPTGLVNNAGIVGPRKRRIEDMDVAIMTEVMRVNVIGALMCAREAAKRMSTRHGGAGGVIEGGGNDGNMTDRVVNSAMKYRTQVAFVDGLMKDLGLPINQLGAAGGMQFRNFAEPEKPADGSAPAPRKKSKDDD